MIHEANGRARELTQFIDVSPDSLRFRLVEQELELASIDKVSLEIVQTDGRELSC